MSSSRLGSISSIVMRRPMEYSASTSRMRLMRVRQLPESELRYSHDALNSDEIDTEVSRLNEGLSMNSFAASIVLSRISSSMPGRAVTLAEIHPLASALRARCDIRTVFPTPRGPENKLHRLGSLGLREKACSNSPIRILRPARMGGTFPKLGVNGFIEDSIRLLSRFFFLLIFFHFANLHYSRWEAYNSPKLKPKRKPLSVQYRMKCLHFTERKACKPTIAHLLFRHRA